MKKNLILIFLICVSLPLQSTWKHTIKKCGIYLGCATAGCIATLFAAQHKKTRPFIKNFLFQNEVVAYEKHVNEIALLTQHNQTLRATNDTLKEKVGTTYLPLIQGLSSQLKDERKWFKDELCSQLTLQGIFHEQKLLYLSTLIGQLEKIFPKDPNTSNTNQENQDLFNSIDQLPLD